MNQHPWHRTIADELVPRIADRLASRSEHDEDSGCLIWTGCKNRRGYGSIRVGQGFMGAHRAAYIVAFGEIPEGMHVDHLCFTPLCIELTHLRLLPADENSGRQRQALADSCRMGHPFTPENTYRNGTRRCRTCRRERDQRRREAGLPT